MHVEIISLEASLAMIVEYRETKNEKLFAKLLAKFDQLIIYTVHKIIGRHTYLQKHDIQDIYHTAIIGFSNALLKIPFDEKPEKIPSWIIAYVKARVWHIYNYMDREEFMSNDSLFDLCANEIVYSQNNKRLNEALMYLDIENIIATADFTKLELDVLIMYLSDDYSSMAAIARVRNVSRQHITTIFKRIVEKCKEFK